MGRIRNFLREYARNAKDNDDINMWFLDLPIEKKRKIWEEHR